MSGVITLTIELGDQVYRAVVPQELIARAMAEEKGVFLTEELIRQAQEMTPQRLIQLMYEDLHRDSKQETPEILRYFYLLMDFERDLPRLLAMEQGRRRS